MQWWYNFCWIDSRRTVFFFFRRDPCLKVTKFAHSRSSLRVADSQLRTQILEKSPQVVLRSKGRQHACGNEVNWSFVSFDISMYLVVDHCSIELGAV